MNVIDKVINLYRRHYKFRNFYSILIDALHDKKLIKLKEIEFLKGVKGTGKPWKGYFKTNKINYRIDLPVWFGDPNARKKIMIYGMEPGYGQDGDNVENVGTKVFGVPFGLVRWDKEAKIKKPNEKYFKAIDNIRKKFPDAFIYLTDVVKEYKIIKNREKSNRNARKNFINNAYLKYNRDIVKREIQIINPTRIITWGNDPKSFFYCLMRKLIGKNILLHVIVKRTFSLGNLIGREEELEKQLNNLKKKYYQGMLESFIKG